MKKLNSSELGGVFGGQGIEIRKNGEEYEILMSVGSFENEKEAEDFIKKNDKSHIVSELFEKSLCGMEHG